MENIPALPKLRRGAFIFSRYLRIIWHAFLVDVCQSYMDVNPLFSLSGEEAQSLRSQGFALNVLNILAMFTPAYCMISLSYDLLSIVAVALGVTEPRTWPLIFGDWKEGYTVRRFWSYVILFLRVRTQFNLICPGGPGIKTCAGYAASRALTIIDQLNRLNL